MKNRTLIGLICIIFAVIITFGISPLINNIAKDTVTVLCAKENLERGSLITEDKIGTMAVNKSAVPEGAITKPDMVQGQYASLKVLKGDVITKDKLTGESTAAEDVFETLNGSRLAVSVTINSFAAGLSGKLKNGDIISFIVTEKGNDSMIPPELTYVKIITTTTAEGVDREVLQPNDDGSIDLPSTITVSVSAEQAVLLAQYESNASVQAALVYRGSKEKSELFLAKQDEFLRGGMSNE